MGTAAAAALLFGAAPAHAQSADQPEETVTSESAAPEMVEDEVAHMDTIVVTARQRDETLLEAPVAVSAVSGATLDRQGVTDVKELAKLAPSLSIDNASSGGGGVISLRGISTSPSNAGFDQAVSVNVDGVQTGRARVIEIGMLDLAQVEVMKGPQALFFGKNSPAGVISLTSASPTREVEGYVRAGYEFEAEESSIEAVLSGPLSDAWSGRIALRYSDMEGWLNNNAGPVTTADWPYAGPTNLPQPPKSSTAGETDLIGRVSLAFEPENSDFSAMLKLGGMSHEDDGPSRGQQVINCGSYDMPSSSYNFGAGFPYVPDPYGDCELDENYSNGALPDGYADNWPIAQQYPFTDMEMLFASLTMNYDFDNFDFTSVTGYFESDTSYMDNYDATVFMGYMAAEHEEYQSISQEFRLLSTFDSPVNFLLGAYYQDTTLDFTNTVLIAPLPVDATTGKYHSWEKPGHTDGEAYSVFGQVIWDITPTVELAGGVRYTDETKDSWIVNTYVHPALAAALAPEGQIYADNYGDTNLSPEVTLTWRPNSNFTTYVAYKTGYKSGGFGVSTNLVPATITVDEIRFDSESIEGFEGGVKSSLFDGHLTLTSSFYSYEYTDLQVNAFDADTTSFKISNAAGATIEGVDLEWNAQMNDWLTLTGGIAYNKARYDDYLAQCWAGQTEAQGCDTTTGTQQLAGKPLSRAPDWTGNVGFDVYTPVFGDFMLGVSGNARYNDEALAGDVYNPAAILDSYWIYDLGLRFEPSSERWQVALIGKNLSDEYITSYVAEKPGAPSTTPGTTGQLMGLANRGRQVLLQGTVRF